LCEIYNVRVGVVEHN